MNHRSGMKTRRSTIFRTAGTLIAIALLVYLLNRMGWEDIQKAFSKLTIYQLGLSFGLIIISRLAVSARWYILLHSAEMGISFQQSVRITFAGLFASNFLPTTIGGDVVRLAGAVQSKVDPATSTASLVVDRLIGMAGMFLALPFGVFSLINYQSSFKQTASMLLIIAAGISKDWFSKLWSRSKNFVQKIIYAGKIWIRKPGSLLLSFAFTLIHMLGIFFTIDILLTAMDEDITFLTISGLYSLVYFITLLPFTINGYGLQELSITFLFHNLSGISIESALTMSIILRTLVILASLPGAFFVGDMISAAGALSTSSQVQSDEIPDLKPPID
jgi:uncharacterized membrane protein YbhN (UPF0104 family)